MAEQIELIKKEDSIQFDISEWEEVPLHEMAQLRKQSEVIALESSEQSNYNQQDIPKQQQQQQYTDNSNNNKCNENAEHLQQNDIMNQDQSQIMKEKEIPAQTTNVRQVQNHYFLFEYGKKFMKYKRYKDFYTFFHQKYEKSLLFDPEEEVFMTRDGIKIGSSPANQIGTSLLYDNETKELVGLSNLAFNIEISTLNKALEQAIADEMQDEEEGNPKVSEINTINLDKANEALISSTASKSKGNSLESIYDWIEKNDKLKQQRIKKQNKTKEIQQDSSSANNIKKQRNPSMNKFIRKVKK